MVGNSSNVFYRTHKTYPIAEHAQGVYLYSQGQRFLDGSSGALVANVGYGQIEVVQAILQQASTLPFVHSSQFSSPVLEEYAKRLANFTGLPSFRFWPASGGSEAIESAIKLARQYYVERGQAGRYKIITRKPSYHGASLGALAASGIGARRSLYNPLFKEEAWPKMPKPDPALSGEEDAQRLRLAIEEAGAKTVAAFIAEPVIGASDAGLSPNTGYYKHIIEICREYDVLFIADEVMSGMGRCGLPLAIQLDNFVTPDIVVLGKGLAAGYAPLAGLMASPQVYNTIMDGSGTFKHGFTYAGHPVSVAAGLAVLNIIERQQLTKQAQLQGSYLVEGLNHLAGKYPQVLQVRGKGLLIGLVLGNPQTKKAYDVPGIADKVAKLAWQRGLITYPGTGAVDDVRGDHILLGPPLCISTAEIDEMLEALDGALLAAQ